MKSKKRAFINLFDILFILILAAIIALIAVFVSPDGKTVTVDYTLIVTGGDADALSEGDLLTAISGGSLGTVTKAENGIISVSAEAELHAGRYFTGASALKEGEEYVVCSGTTRLICTLDGITKR